MSIRDPQADPRACPRCGQPGAIAMTVLHRQGVASMPPPPDLPTAPRPPLPSGGSWIFSAAILVTIVVFEPPADRPITIGFGVLLRVAVLVVAIWWADRRRITLIEEHQRKMAVHPQQAAWWGMLSVSPCCHLMWCPPNPDGVYVPPHEPVYAGLEQDKRAWDLAGQLASRSMAEAAKGRGKPLDWARVLGEEASVGKA